VKQEKYSKQKTDASKNERKILNILSMGEMTFTNLKNHSGLSDPGLLMVLTRLLKNNKIYRKQRGKKVFYSISSSVTAKEIWYLGDVLDKLRAANTKYYIDFSDNHMSEATGYGPPFGILSHLFLDKDIGKSYNPLSKRDVFELEKLVFDRIKENIADNPIKINQKIKSQSDKKIVIAFDIDYASLVKALEEYKGIKEEKMVNARRRELMR
jgi:DNA-binding transcriptional ArsR family regulator